MTSPAWVAYLILEVAVVVEIGKKIGLASPRHRYRTRPKMMHLGGGTATASKRISL